MIQDIFPMHLSNEYHKKVPQADSFLMIFKDNYILAKNDGQVIIFTCLLLFGKNLWNLLYALI